MWVMPVPFGPNRESQRDESTGRKSTEVLIAAGTLLS